MCGFFGRSHDPQDRGGSGCWTGGLGPNFPVRYVADPRYRVQTPEDPLAKRARGVVRTAGREGDGGVRTRQPRTSGSRESRWSPQGARLLRWFPRPGHGWAENKWNGPWDMPQSYMVPAGTDAAQIGTNPHDRMHGTVRGEYPAHYRSARGARCQEEVRRGDWNGGGENWV